MTPFAAILLLLKSDFRHEILVETIAHMSATITDLESYLVELTKGLDPDNAEFLHEIGEHTIEHLQGGGLVVCQARITNVTSLIKKVHQHLEKAGQSTLAVPKKKLLILNACSKPVDNTTISQIVAINALANYFKHRDEWPNDWSKATGQTAETIASLRQLGFDRNDVSVTSRGIAFVARGLINIPDIIRTWQLELHALVERELKKKSIV